MIVHARVLAHVRILNFPCVNLDNCVSVVYFIYFLSNMTNLMNLPSPDEDKLMDDSWCEQNKNLRKRKAIRVSASGRLDVPLTLKRNGFTVRQSWHTEEGGVARRGSKCGGELYIVRERVEVVRGGDSRSDGAITPLISLRQPC